MLVGLELVSVTRDEDVDVELPLYQRQSLRVTPRHHLVTVAQADPELTYSDHLLLRVAQVLVEVAADNVHVAGQRLQIVVGLLGAQVARAENVLDAAWDEQFLEFSRQTATPVWNVEIAQHEHQLANRNKIKPIDPGDDVFWSQFWSESLNSVQDVFTLVPAAEIRALREEAPQNLATLCYKSVERLVSAVDASCRTQRDHETVLNCVRLLTRLLPYIFEDPDWRGFFWTSLPAGQPSDTGSGQVNRWVAHFTSSENRHALPVFTSLLNVCCSYDPVGLGLVPYNHLIFTDSREPLVETALQILIATLDHEGVPSPSAPPESGQPTADNLFVNYLSRIHRDEDFGFVLRGFTRLLNNPLAQTYLPNSTKKVMFHQELLIFFWKFCDYNKTLSMVASTKLLHLLEAFSTPWFLFSAPTNHHLVFFLLEIFNNIIQYQFDGNSNLVYTIIRKRQVFHALANLPSDYGTISRSLTRRSVHGGKATPRPTAPQPSPAVPSITSEVRSEVAESQLDEELMEGSKPAMPAEPGTLKATLPATPGIEKMTERESAHPTSHQLTELTHTQIQQEPVPEPNTALLKSTEEEAEEEEAREHSLRVRQPSVAGSDAGSTTSSTTSSVRRAQSLRRTLQLTEGAGSQLGTPHQWVPTSDWVQSWKSKLPLQTIMRLLQVLVPQVEKICIDKGLTDESEILKFLQHGTLVGLLPVPHPILIRKYQANHGTTSWFRTYMWGVIYLRNVDPPIWYNTDVKLFEIQRV
ncbi:hypothetical protein B566_EDAN008340 [Ephemera danica]|nr:hypothetical protein B566_EDAN008340 [Ephemera danica]